MQSIKYMVGKCFVGNMPQIVQHPVLAQKANCCSYDQSDHLHQAGGNGSCVIQDR